MIFMRILPGVLKDLLKHVPTVLFEAVEWSELAHELPKLSRRIIKKEGFQELLDHQAKFLKPFGINLVTEFNQPHQLKGQLAGEQILISYFAQVYSPHGIFLDLSSSHFNLQGQQLEFKPSGVWTKFGPEFSQGLHEIYDGFYLEDEKTFQQGLLRSGLVSPAWTDAERKELGDLFKSNFGPSLTAMKFDLESFKNSFIKIADFLLERKMKISTDFMYLGIALVTLYSSLEATGATINVKEVYLRLKQNLPSK